MRKEFNSQGILLVHQHGRRFIALEHQYGRRDVMWKRSIYKDHAKAWPIETFKGAIKGEAIESVYQDLYWNRLKEIHEQKYYWRKENYFENPYMVNSSNCFFKFCFCIFPFFLVPHNWVWLVETHSFKILSCSKKMLAWLLSFWVCSFFVSGFQPSEPWVYLGIKRQDCTSMSLEFQPCFGLETFRGRTHVEVLHADTFLTCKIL